MRYFRVPGAVGVSWEDVAGILAMCSDGVSTLARVKYAAESRHRDLKYCLLVAVAGDERLNGFESGTLQPMAELAILEVCGPAMCKACGGVGSALEGELVAVCARCNGTGIKRQSERYNADYVGVSRHRWRKHVRKQYQVMVDKLTEWEVELFQKLLASRNQTHYGDH
jgi:hypothetical protein